MKTKLTFLILFSVVIGNSLDAQLYLKAGGAANTGAKVNIYSSTATPIYLVLNPGAAPAAGFIAIIYDNTTFTDRPSGIIMNKQTTRLSFNIGALAVGGGKKVDSISVPYMDIADEASPTIFGAYPVSLRRTAAGTGANGKILFSSIRTTGARNVGWDNNNYKPTGVLTMNGLGSVNRSAYTIDRFWIIEAIGYTVKPDVSMDFTYNPQEALANGGNTITHSNIRLQHWDSVNATNGDWKPFIVAPLQGTPSTTASTYRINNVTAAAANFFRSWAANDNTAPLPIELLSFVATCDGKNTLLKWATATETNNDFFTVERSSDMANWTDVGTVDGAGNSTQTLNYQFTDNAPLNTLAYYRLKQTDFNGDFKYADVVSSNCDQEGVDFVNIYPNPSNGTFSYVISSTMETEISVKAYDALGQKIIDQVISIEKGVSSHTIETNTLRNGVYYLKIETSNGLYKGQKQFVVH